METTRLTYSSDEEDEGARRLKRQQQQQQPPSMQRNDEEFQVINKPLTQMSLKTQIQVASLIKREPLMQACGKVIRVEFDRGPLGLQLADVGPRVLVTALEDCPDGSPGQARRSGLVEVGHQVVAIAGRSCLNLTMKELLRLISIASRPMTVDFQPLIIPKFPSKDSETIFSRLGDDGELEVRGEPYEVEFPQKFLGLNIGHVRGLVVVSQFMNGGDSEVLRPISLGDRLLEVKSRRKVSGDDSASASFEDLSDSGAQQWKVHDCRQLDFAQIAAIVRDAGRPVRIVFEPTEIVRRLVKRHSLRSKQSSTGSGSMWGIRPRGKPKCPSCRVRGPTGANFCWKCGYRITRAEEESEAPQDADLIGQFEDEDVKDNESRSENSNDDDDDDSVDEKDDAKGSDSHDALPAAGTTARNDQDEAGSLLDFS
ncbi:Hypothetical Protein FCC1311_019642 [Hondaea fermentalgiana]|uniref:PDZ domain-containing protein n=1 Tax=Hondaea fermentalgiana TaxID=2315210 RepID=A0A2R5G5C8_9STRA|nr:Hypothetical Protein FCC1311_019642 [Hondaea fermentalgiana]|eukprot:GBG25745.1 Hypothetical Protein FCC1311_019642 [Hondaea fermentalgiana]